MKPRFTAFLFLLFGLFACEDIPTPIPPSPPVPESPFEAQLREPIEFLRTSAEIPGLAVGIVEGEHLTYEDYFGVVSANGDRAVNRETRFTAGPLSAMVTTIAVLQLANEGKVDLDAHVNEYLDWDLLHPVFPQATISLRMLLSQVSSIRDDSLKLAALVTAGDHDGKLRDFFASYLIPGGALYAPSNFDAQRPGKVLRYSAVAIALAAHVVESVAKVPFSVWCETNLFAKLGFSSDSWFLSNLPDPGNVAIPHRVIGGDLTAQSLYSYPMYPAGLLRVNLRSSSRLWRALVQEGAFGDQRFFSATENQTLREVQFPGTSADQALGWRYDSLAGRQVLVSGGEELGYTTLSCFDPSRKLGVILLANAAGHGEALEEMAMLMFNAIP